MDGVDADQWTTAAQDEGKWRKTVEQGAECFMAKWIVAEKARTRLRNSMSERRRGYPKASGLVLVRSP